MKRSRTGYLLAGGLMVGLLLAATLLADWITPVSPHYWDAKSSILLGQPPFAPDARHWLGTDQYGRDVLTRVIYGTRWSLLFAALIMGSRLLLALPAAFLSVFGPRGFSWVVGRLYVVTSAIPPLVIYILLLSPPGLRLVGLWPSVGITVSVLALVEWPRIAVVLKGRLEHLMAEPFVEGAIAAGASSGRVFRRHLLPHLWPVLLQILSIEMSRGLLVIAQLGLFGILVGGGVMSIVGDNTLILTTGIPEWGNLLADGRVFLARAPWIPFVPAMAFFVAVVGFNLLAQGLEGANLSLYRFKEAIISRTTPVLRWTGVTLLLLALGATGYAYGVNRSDGKTQGLSTLRGYYHDLVAVYDLADPRAEAIHWRWAVQLLATTADHAYETVMPIFPDAGKDDRPVIRFYLTQEEFQQEVPEALEGETVRFWPGGPIHISPDFLNGQKRWDLQKNLSREYVRHLTASQWQKETLNPLVMGIVERQGDGGDRYGFNIYKLAGSRLMTLEQLYQMPQTDMTQAQVRLYAAQAALLSEAVDQQRTAGPLTAREAMAVESPADLARLLGRDPAALVTSYDEEIYQRTAEESIISIPTVRERISEELIMAVEAWIGQAAGSGYEAVLLDADVTGQVAKVYLVERLSTGSVRPEAAIAVQDWALRANEWLPVSDTVLRKR